MMVAMYLATALVICYTKESLCLHVCRAGRDSCVTSFITQHIYLILQVQVGSSPHQLHHHISSTPPGCFNEGSLSILCSDRQCVGTNIHNNIEQARRLWRTVGTTQRWMKGTCTHVHVCVCTFLVLYSTCVEGLCWMAGTLVWLHSSLNIPHSAGPSWLLPSPTPPPHQFYPARLLV